MKSKAFLGGALFGALLVVTFGATDSPTTWEYKAQIYDLGNGTSNDSYYTKALNAVSTNGWEVLCSHRIDFRNVEIVLKRAR